jgi:signal transduction histidine kinase
VELVVEDTGIGIPTEELPLLGKRFHRVQTPGGRSHEGTGIGTLHPFLAQVFRRLTQCAGLAMVFELVRLHGGTVSVESQLGHGSLARASTLHIAF